MGTSERRKAIMRLLCKRRFEIIENIAAEFDVSERTIRRDIEKLSLTEPIYTKSGRYGGGVYVVDGYYPDSFSFNSEQSAILNKLLRYAECNNNCVLQAEEIAVFRKLLLQHTAL